MSHPVKSAALLFVSMVMLVARYPVNGLKENEEVKDDFDTGTAEFWQWTPGDEENSTTIWHLSKHGDPPPFDIDAVRPPMEDNGGGYLEIVPFSDSPAQILSSVFDLLPYATVEMTYWNVVPFPILVRNTVLILYLEFQNVTLNDETGIEPPLRTVSVFKAPTPTDPSPGWTTVTIDLPITEPCQVQLRIDGTRTNLPTTGLAVSKITVKNGVDVSTTTSTTMSSTTSRAQSPSTEAVTTPTRYAVDKTTSTKSTTTPTTTPTSTSAPGATPPTSTTLDPSTVTSAATEETTVSDFSIVTTETIPSSSSTSTSSPATLSPISTVTTSTSKPQMTATSSSLSSTVSTPTLPTSSGTNPIVTTSSTIGLSTTTATIDLPNTTSSTSKPTPTSSTTTSSAFSTSRPTTSASMPASTDSTDPPTTPSPPSGMTTNQLRDVLIGVGVAILLFSLFCLLFTICYRRHRRRAYLIENRKLENGIIRPLELTDQFPYTIHKNESDSSSISSTTASDSPLAPNPPAQTSVKDLLPNFLRSLSNTSSKITKLA